MSLARAPFVAAVLACGLVWTPPAIVAAQSVPGPAASLSLRTPGGQRTFRLGEEIRLTLEFLGVADKDYYFSTETSDRSGRLTSEEYEITPSEDISDPLIDALGGISGGLRGVHALDDTPFVLTVSLNDWMRFAKPGTYRLVVISHRLHRYSAGAVDPLRSAPIDFEIVPADQEWRARQLAEATRLIDEGTRDEIRHGAALLRYLGTEDAARALVDRFSIIARTNAWDAEAAILSSPARTTVVKAMEERVDAGDALDPAFIPTLARVALLAETTRANDDAAARSARLDALRSSYDTRWHAALAVRPTTPSVLAAELARLVEPGSDANRKQIGDDVAAHPAEAGAAFLILPLDIQRGVLEFQWPYVNRSWIAPALLRVYARWHGDYRFPGVGDIALRRLVELQPEVGRLLVLDEIKTGEHGIGYETLAGLHDDQIPELDDALRVRAAREGLNPPWLTANNREITSWLIARYGSAALLPFVKSRFDERACGTAAPELVFLLKHDADAAAHALAACNLPPLATLAPRYWDAQLEAAAIKRLNATDRAQATDAARALGLRGSSAAKQPLLERLTRLNHEAAARGLEGPSDPLESVIVVALLQNKQIVLTPEDVVAIRTSCLTDSCRYVVEARSKSIR